MAEPPQGTEQQHVDLPTWLQPVARAARDITVQQLTRFPVPPDAEPRSSAVLVLFGEGEHGPDLVLTERAHGMRSHPGQVSFPGGSLDPGEDAVDAALREAWEETGLDPAGVEVFATLPDLWLPPSNHAVTPVLAWWREPSPLWARSAEEVHAVYRVPLAELCDPAHRIVVPGPSGWRSPGILIGEHHDVICWGFTAGIIVRLFEFLGWLEDLPEAPEHHLPDYMLVGRPTTAPAEPTTEFQERRG